MLAEPLRVAAHVCASSTSRTYVDLQQTRPTVQLVDGVTRRIHWPSIELVAGVAGRDVVVVDRARAVGPLAGRHRRARRSSRSGWACAMPSRSAGCPRRCRTAGRSRCSPPRRAARSRRRSARCGPTTSARPGSRPCCRSRWARPASAPSGSGPRCRTTWPARRRRRRSGRCSSGSASSTGVTVDLHGLDDQTEAYLEQVEDGSGRAARRRRAGAPARGGRPVPRSCRRATTSPARSSGSSATSAEPGGSGPITCAGNLTHSTSRRTRVSVVKINAITVPAERADELVARFAARAGEVERHGRASRRSSCCADRRPRDVPRLHAVAIRGGLPGLDGEPGVRSTATRRTTRDGPVSTHAELW